MVFRRPGIGERMLDDEYTQDMANPSQEFSTVSAPLETV